MCGGWNLSLLAALGRAGGRVGEDLDDPGLKDGKLGERDSLLPAGWKAGG